MSKNRFVTTKNYSKSDIAAFFLAGALCGSLFLGTVLHFDKPAPALTQRIGCRECHKPEIVCSTLNGYKKKLALERQKEIEHLRLADQLVHP